jgi:hypothetical protein
LDGEWCDGGNQLRISPTFKLRPEIPRTYIGFNDFYKKFQFRVEANYYRENVTWVVDFDKWDETNRQINQPNNCENRLANSYSGLNFTEYWHSGPHASAEYLNTLDYPTYGPSGKWKLVPMSCTKVLYEAFLTWDELLGCRGSTGHQLVNFNYLEESKVMQYSGYMTVTAVEPFDGDDHSRGYRTTEFNFQFALNFNTYCHDVMNMTSDYSFQLSVRYSKLTALGVIQVRLITTIESDNGSYLYYGQLAGLDEGADGNVTDISGIQGPCSVDGKRCVQYWDAEIRTSHRMYNGVIYVHFYVMECNANGQCVKTPNGVTGRFTLETALNENYLGLNYDIGCHMSKYNNKFENEYNGIFHSSDTVYLKSALNLNAEDYDNFELRVQNFWICYTDDPNYVIEYAPLKGKFGCMRLVPGFIEDNTRIHLIYGTTILNQTERERAFKATIYEPKSNSALPYWSNIGISFAAQPLTTLNKTFSIHVEIIISQRMDEIIDGSPVQDITVNQIYSSSELNSKSAQSTSIPDQTASTMATFRVQPDVNIEHKVVEQVPAKQPTEQQQKATTTSDQIVLETRTFIAIVAGTALVSTTVAAVLVLGLLYNNKKSPQ